MANLNSFVMVYSKGQWQNVFWLCVQMAGDVAVYKLLFQQPRGFSSNGNKKWSALPSNNNTDV